MPSPSPLPFLMSIGMLIAGLGFIARGNYSMAILGLVFVIIVMFVRSFEQDHGYHIDLK
jgi:cytochrome c oxidase subunit 1